MHDEKERYAGLFWGTVVPDEIREQVLAFLRGPQAAVELAQLPCQTWRLEDGALCVGLPLAEVPPVPGGLIASSQAIRSIPARWIADEHLDQVRYHYLMLQQVAAQHAIRLSPGETLMVTPFRAEEPGPGKLGTGLAAREGYLLECLGALEELDLSLLAVQVPDAWGLASPYWTPGHLIEILTGQVYVGATRVPLEELGEAPARFVLVQDAEQGVFAEIHCKCGEGEDALTRLLVVDVLANAGAQDWVRSRRTSRWLEVTLSIVTEGLLSW
jgi:hypothetical protein